MTVVTRQSRLPSRLLSSIFCSAVVLWHSAAVVVPEAFAQGADLPEVREVCNFEEFAFMPGSTSIQVQTPVLLRYTTGADDQSTLIYHKAMFAQKGWTELPDTGEFTVFVKDGYKIKFEIGAGSQGQLGGFGPSGMAAGGFGPGGMGPGGLGSPGMIATSGMSPPPGMRPTSGPGGTSGPAGASQPGLTGGSPPPGSNPNIPTGPTSGSQPMSGMTSGNSGSQPMGPTSDPRLPPQASSSGSPPPSGSTPTPPSPPGSIGPNPGTPQPPGGGMLRPATPGSPANVPPPVQLRNESPESEEMANFEMMGSLQGLAGGQGNFPTGSTTVTLTHLGNVDITDVPTPRSLTNQELQLESSSFRTRGNVFDFIKAIESELKKNRWKIVSRSQQACVARQGIVILNVTAKPSSTRGYSDVEYKLESSSTNFPVLDGVPEVRLSEENREMDYQTRRPRREIISFYKGELKKQGWEPDDSDEIAQDESTTRGEVVETFNFTNSDQDQLKLVVTGQARTLQRSVNVTQVSGAKVNGKMGLDHVLEGHDLAGGSGLPIPAPFKMMLDGLVATSGPLPDDAPDFLSEKVSPSQAKPTTRKPAASKNQLISTTINGSLSFKDPEGATNSQTTTTQKRFEVPPGSTKETVAAIRDSLLADNWKLTREWTQGLNENISYQKENQRIFIRYTETGLRPTIFVINGVNLTFDTEEVMSNPPKP